MTNASMFDSFVPDSTNGIPAGRRVKLVAGTRKITLAAADDREVAVTMEGATHNRYPVACRLVNGGGCIDVECNGEVGMGAVVKRDAAGKVAVAGAGSDFGVADEGGTNAVISTIPF